VDNCQDENVSLNLAELAAIRAGSAEISIEHIVLGLSQHPLWYCIFDEGGLEHARLHAVLGDEQQTGLRLPFAPETEPVVQKARELCTGRGDSTRPPCGPHLLEAIMLAKLPVAQALQRQFRVPIEDVIKKWQCLCPSRIAETKRDWTTGVVLAVRRLLPAYLALLGASVCVLLLGAAAYSLFDSPEASFGWFTGVVTDGALIVFFSFPVLLVLALVLGMARLLLRSWKRSGLAREYLGRAIRR